MKYTPATSKDKSGLCGNKSTKEKQTVVEGSGKLDFGEYELELWDLRYNSILHNHMRKMQGGRSSGKSWLRDWLRPSCVPITIVVTLSMLIMAMALLDDNISRNQSKYSSCDQCSFRLVESIPENLTYSPGSVQYDSIYSAWASLIDGAETSIDIAAFYWTLRNDDVLEKPVASSWQGEDIFRRLNETGSSKNVLIRIAQNSPSSVSPQNDSAILAAVGAAQVRSLDFDHLMGGGVLHTKMWIVDNQHLYLGSANMDWRSLTQVYWELGKEGAEIPPVWPHSLETIYDIQNQMSVLFSGTVVNTYLSSSPPPFCPKGRSNDIDAIINVINKAEKFIYIAVMDYFPKMLYTKEKKFWPVIDDSLRAAAMERGVRVRILGSHWTHTRPDMKYYLRSLQDLTSIATKMDIEARLFVVPAYTEEQQEIPFARVNHNKYMVTDNTAYIGTSNWSGDYFINTGGIGLVVNETDSSAANTETAAEDISVRQQLQALFERDWTSEHARPLDDFFP
ncbi:5'-3' exonuclease PLD3-like isoform X2 [Homarus americanus]|uniref:5'-3' exonuclease PLD3-like isoform X2 n=1 Tax=Homarus americanus TaxID=6706 RepID=UPI001C485E6E|nr:5'-3' exonuclease PLD3-like isoform X2 [Homarus americanus]